MSQNWKFRFRAANKEVGYYYIDESGIGKYVNSELEEIPSEPEYSEIDECVGIVDGIGTPIFELDIISCQWNDPSDLNQLAIVLWEEKKERFLLLNIKTEEVLPLEIEGIYLFNPEGLRVMGHLYENRSLKKKLGLNTFD